jgi:hypothetical protein
MSIALLIENLSGSTVNNKRVDAVEAVGAAKSPNPRARVTPGIVFKTRVLNPVAGESGTGRAERVPRKSLLEGERSCGVMKAELLEQAVRCRDGPQSTFLRDRSKS